MTYEQMQKVLSETIKIQKENSKGIKELRANQEAIQKETSKHIKDLGQQIGGLGNKFGTFTEGLSMPSLEKILKTTFCMDEIYYKLKSTHNGGNLELDMLGAQNSGVDCIMVVEIKGKVIHSSIKQLKHILEQMDDYFPSFKGRAKIGMLAGVIFSKELLLESQKAGFYCATINDDQYILQSPDGFKT